MKTIASVLLGIFMGLWLLWCGGYRWTEPPEEEAMVIHVGTGR